MSASNVVVPVISTARNYSHVMSTLGRYRFDKGDVFTQISTNAFLMFVEASPWYLDRSSVEGELGRQREKERNGTEMIT